MAVYDERDNAESNNVLNVEDLSLEDWLQLLRKPPKNSLFIRNRFPTGRHQSEFHASISRRSDDDVRLLLRHFLVCTGSNPMDLLRAEALIKSQSYKKQLTDHDHRLLRHVISDPDHPYPVWEGLHWVIDLLPSRPRKALDVLDAFFDARWEYLTDNYMTGLSDAKELIRAFYITGPMATDRPSQTLHALNWRELEWLLGILYEHMGFQVTVTERSDDNGVDVLAERGDPGLRDCCVVQVKKWRDSNPVGKREVRELIGTIDHQQATRGVIVTTGRFESGAEALAARDKRIEVMTPHRLLEILALHCGTDWHTRVERLIANAKQAHREKQGRVED